MEELNDDTRDRLILELQRDKDKSFAEEFERTTNLERRILDRHGRSGAELLLLQQGFEVASGHGCPWQLEGMDAVAAVRHVLQPLIRVLPEFLATLEERIRWVLPVHDRHGWKLAYIVDLALYDGRAYYGLILGGAPNAAPGLSARASSLGWQLPRSFAAFCAVHDGMGTTDGGILPSASLVDLGQMMDPIAAEQGFHPQGYVFQDLLEFCPDGSGNCQAFHRQGRDDADPLTVDWDHETHEISDGTPFFAFADEQLLGLIQDEE